MVRSETGPPGAWHIPGGGKGRIPRDMDQLGALGASQAQCARSATIWASGRTRDPYFEILGAPRGIMVTPSGGFEFRFCSLCWGPPRMQG